MAHHIYVGSYASEVYTLAFNPDVPSLTLLSSVTVGHHPSWVTSYPSDPSIIFTGLEQADGKVVTLKYDGAGKGTVVGCVSSGGADPCTLVVADDQLLVGNVRELIVSRTPTFMPLLIAATLFLSIPQEY